MHSGAHIIATIFKTLQMKVSFVQYGIQIQHGSFKNATTDTSHHSCIFELKKKQADSRYHMVSECELKVKSTLVRLVPHCDKISK